MRASQPWRFFCIVTPGLEALAMEEFREKRGLLKAESCEPQLLSGGFEVILPWESGRALGAILKLPTRVLVRLTQLTARDFPKLFQKARSLPWTEWLAHPVPLWKVTAHQCRLMHTGRLAETLAQALSDAHRQRPFSLRWQKESILPETLYVRGVGDVWSISLDITGEALYKRGFCDVKGEAPLRETLAAAVLRRLFNQPTRTNIHLWDPCCGSGTFLFEAAHHFSPASRAFAYQNSTLNLGVAPWRAPFEMAPWPFQTMLGSDINGELLKKLPTHPAISWHTHDITQGALSFDERFPLWVVTNPPYGERLAVSGGIQQFNERLAASLAQARPDQVAMVVPVDWPTLAIKGLKPLERLPFSNGGLAVEARLWGRAQE